MQNEPLINRPMVQEGFSVARTDVSKAEIRKYLIRLSVRRIGYGYIVEIRMIRRLIMNFVDIVFRLNRNA